MPRIDQDSVKKWHDFDSQTVTKQKGDVETVDHGASALANLKQVGKDIVEAFDPTNHLRKHTDLGSNDAVAFVAGVGVDILLLPWRLAAEVGDVLFAPVRIVKDLGDAAVHGVAAGIAKLHGDDE
jgi:hypothetical protein